MKLYKTNTANILQKQADYYLVSHDWDNLINQDNLYQYLVENLHSFEMILPAIAAEILKNGILPPIGNQEVWAAGVTYSRSMEARKEESKASGGADLYDRVYYAERPEIFFKSLAHRVAGDGQLVYIRKDSDWNVPEPELTLYINAAGKIQAYTIGNDMSSRSIEGENALYLPQAKIYERSAALGPCLYVPESVINPDTLISINIFRSGSCVYNDGVSINKMKRSLQQLADYLYRECDFKFGCFLMTGTCLVPPNDFTLRKDDVVEISIEAIGILTNRVEFKPKNRE